MFERLSHVMMYVQDLDRAVKWYAGTLGFVPNFVVPNAYASLRHERTGTRIDLHPTEAKGADVGYGPIPNFLTRDIDSARAELQKKGVKVSDIKTEGNSPRFMVFWDSEGNALGLEEHKN
jgi:catechol 2,3-dioxygenase-like lactoylglutathione lyase family enzyme